MLLNVKPLKMYPLIINLEILYTTGDLGGLADGS